MMRRRRDRADQAPRLGWRDQVSEAWASIRARPARSATSTLVAALGVGAALAAIGIADTGRHQVGAAFDALRATEVTVQGADPSIARPFAEQDVARVRKLSGVRGAGIMDSWRSVAVTRTSSLAVDGSDASPVELTATTSAGLWAADAQVSGALSDGLASGQVLVGRLVASELGIPSTIDPLNPPAMRVDGFPVTVSGVIIASPHRSRLLGSVVASPSVARRFIAQVPDETVLLIRVAPGAASTIADQAPLALDPGRPDRFEVTAPPEPASLRLKVEAATTWTILAVASIVLLIGAASIASTTTTAVLERTAELGLRRVFGASRAHLVRHILTEAALLGTIGGVAGALGGFSVALVVTSARHWQPVINPWLWPAGPIAGIACGLVAGWFPARRASRIQPRDALAR